MLIHLAEASLVYIITSSFIPFNLFNMINFLVLLFIFQTRTEGATISGLEPATAYLVRARTVTAQFASAHTRALLALTLHEPPSRAPISLRASAPRPTTIELAWQVKIASNTSSIFFITLVYSLLMKLNNET